LGVDPGVTEEETETLPHPYEAKGGAPRKNSPVSRRDATIAAKGSQVWATRLEEARPGLAKGPSGVGVRTLVHFAENFAG